MKQLGWMRSKKRFGGKSVWAYCIDDASGLAVLPLPEITVLRDGQTGDLQITVKDASKEDTTDEPDATDEDVGLG
jgi:hypothetical protein